MPIFPGERPPTVEELASNEFLIEIRPSAEELMDETGGLAFSIVPASNGYNYYVLRPTVYHRPRRNAWFVFDPNTRTWQGQAAIGANGLIWHPDLHVRTGRDQLAIDEGDLGDLDEDAPLDLAGALDENSPSEAPNK